MTRLEADQQFDWKPAGWFAERWGLSVKTARRRLRELHALKGAARMGAGSGLRYHVSSVQQALLEQED